MKDKPDQFFSYGMTVAVYHDGFPMCISFEANAVLKTPITVNKDLPAEYWWVDFFDEKHVPRWIDKEFFMPLKTDAVKAGKEFRILPCQCDISNMEPCKLCDNLRYRKHKIFYRGIITRIKFPHD